MDKEISKDLFEVENPIYQSYEDIMKQYIDKMIVMTNKQPSERGSGKLFNGGIVRYYGKQRSDEIYDKWGDCLEINEYDPVIIIGLFTKTNPFGGLYLGWIRYEILFGEFVCKYLFME